MSRIFAARRLYGNLRLLSLVTGLLYARFAARAAYGWGARIREAQYQKVQGFAFSNLIISSPHPW